MEITTDQWIITTIAVALISLVGNLLQYIFYPKKSKSNAELEVAQTLRTITEAYDKLFMNLRLEIEGFEEELRLQNAVIDELRKIKDSLEEKADKQQRQLQAQNREIQRLKKQLASLQQDNKNRDTQDRIKALKNGE